MLSSSTFPRASFGVHRRVASAVPSPHITRQASHLTEACIHPIGVDRADAVNHEDLPDVDAPALLVHSHSLLGARVIIPDLLGLDLSHHPSAYLCANKV